MNTPLSTKPSETENPKLPESMSRKTIARIFSRYPAVATDRKSRITSSRNSELSEGGRFSEILSYCQDNKIKLSQS